MSILGKFRKLLNKQLPDQHHSLKILRARFVGLVYYRHVFGSFGAGTSLETPLRLHNARNIHIGSGVVIGARTRLETIYSTPEGKPSLIIEDHVAIENDVQLIAHCSLILRKGSGVGPRCVIMDASHPFMDVKDVRPIHARLSTAASFVEIGEGALIGAGTFISPNVRIGKGSVIGANSVVRKSIPDYCVAAGNPAQIQLRYNSDEDRWLPVRP